MRSGSLRGPHPYAVHLTLSEGAFDTAVKVEQLNQECLNFF